MSSPAYNTNYDGKTPIDKVVLSPIPQPLVYSKPGSYTIIQGASGNGNSTGFVSCQTVTVLPLDPIKFNVKACAGPNGYTATLDIDPASLGQYELFNIDWGEPPAYNSIGKDALLTPHKYSKSGTYTVKISGKYIGLANCDGPVSTQTVSFSITTQPVITKLTTVSDNSISIQYQASTGASVQLYQKNASGTYEATSQTGNGTAPFVVQTDAKQVQCFQIVAQDACNTAGIRSDEVCSLVLNAKADNKQNNLSWQPYAGTATGSQFKYYRINRNGVPVGGLITVKNTGTYPDNNGIVCGSQYCYTVEATIASSAQTVVTSAPICVTGINDDGPGSFGDIVVSIEDNHPRLVAALPKTGTPSSYSITVSRADGSSGVFQPVGALVNKNVYIDQSANPSTGSYCYQLTYQANCGLTSPPSSPVCTVFLSSKSSTGINWTNDSPFSSGATAGYTVEVIDTLNNTRDTKEVGSSTHFEPDPNDPNLQSQKYRIIAASAKGEISYSNFFTFRREALVWVPDAFTPNGDGNNDVFIAGGFYVDQFRMSIYDRWGSVIYSTSDKTKGWDGTANGQPALVGQYMYRIEITDLTGQKTVRTGGLLLIR